MPLPARLARLHAAVRAPRPMRAFTVACRVLLALAFLPSGWTKLAGHRFTQIGIEHPIGFFFEALYRTGPYYRFIGAGQVIAALLLLVPRTAPLGALLALPIVANIVVLTVSLHFTGTVFVTVPLLLACTYLVLWDYDRYHPMLAPTFGWTPLLPPVPPPGAEDAARVSAAVVTAGAALAVLGGVLLVGTEPQRPDLPVAEAVGVVLWALAPLAAWAVRLRRAPRRAPGGVLLWTAAALLMATLATVVAWTPAHPEASARGVWGGAALVLWAVVGTGEAAARVVARRRASVEVAAAA